MIRLLLARHTTAAAFTSFCKTAALNSPSRQSFLQQGICALSTSSSNPTSTKNKNKRPVRYVILTQERVDQDGSDSTTKDDKSYKLPNLDTFIGNRDDGSFSPEPRHASAVQRALIWLGNATSTLASPTQLRANAMHQCRTAAGHLLPKDYVNSVSPTYLAYAQWSMGASVAGTVTGVLSMQSLLFAMGLGAGSVPIAAALNWIIKDGLGQLGGVLYASTIHHRFDSDPKRWRFTAAVIFDISMLLEVLTPLFPQYFLPMAALANVGKNVGWLSASATRAGMHKAFIKRNNLADVTGKAGSQSIAASVVGTAAGVVISPFIGTDPFAVLTAALAISAIHLTCTYKSICAVVLPTLNVQRAWIATRDSFNLNEITTGIKENCNPERSSNIGNGLDPSRLYDPASVYENERFVHSGKWGGPIGRVLLAPSANSFNNVQTIDNSDEQTEHSPCHVRLDIAPSLKEFASSTDDLDAAIWRSEDFQDRHLLRIQSLDANGAYVTHNKRSSSSNWLTQQISTTANNMTNILDKNASIETPKFAVQLLFFRHADPDHIALGTLHAFAVARSLSHGAGLSDAISKSTNVAVFESENEDWLIRETRNSLGKDQDGSEKWLTGLAAKGWDTAHVFMEEKRARVVVSETAIWPPNAQDEGDGDSSSSGPTPVFCMTAEKGR